MELGFFEFNFKSPEYLTENSWQERWRQFFLIEIRKSAPYVIRELAELLPEWREGTSGLSIENMAQWANADRLRFDRFFQRLSVWQAKYGLNVDQEGHYPKWVWEVVKGTFLHWDKHTPNSADIGRSFETGGVEIKPLEEVMARPEVLVQECKVAIHGTETEEDIKNNLQIEAWMRQHQEECRRAAAGVELILPPKGYPSWWPVFQTKKNYLKQAYHIVQQRIINDPILGQAESSARKSFINAVLEPVNLYCQRLAKHYEENGYRKPPNARTVEQQIAWTVQVQVIGRRMSGVAQETGNHLSRIQPVVQKVLKHIDLSLRKDITPGRPKHSKNSPIAHLRKP